jgi:2Fe-2S ferredoxin
MALIYDKIYIDEDFGECKGMGRCGTCIIEILNPNIEITVLDRNESINLEKMGMKKQNTHLACQIEVDKYIEGLEIKILHD